MLERTSAKNVLDIVHYLKNSMFGIHDVSVVTSSLVFGLLVAVVT
jgi:hypothetical protein